MIRKTSSALFMTTMLVGALSSVGAQADWKGWNIHTEDYPVSHAMEFFITEADKRTEGRISGRVYNNAVLGSQEDAISQMQIGGIDFAGFNLGPLGASVPEVNVVSLPFIFKDVEHMHRVMDGPVGQSLSDAMAKTGVISLAWYDSGARSFYNTSKAIHSPADIQGMKFRVMNNDLYVGMVEALGGNATPMAYSEVYQSLKTGVVDGAENNWPSYESSNHYEVSPYYSATQHLILPECLCVSTTAWKKLSVEDQETLKKVARESATLQRDLWAKRDLKSKQAVLDAGVNYNEIDDKSAFQSAMKPVYEMAIKKNPALAPIVKEIQATP
ncbi:TRAP transporter substrate-binding protein [Neptunomonas phycophila]|uniref:TRAP transporter substrate-binding protein n=1 Tax=Neptunomonas TaxID=75687 RepID=UPI0015BAFCC0|nr:TRAP transporter substrate-binding protein [Neptunomonas phycophila]QLE98660.1 TRAP transporter substrate-binding protein [Neptunomonas phycophila]